MLIEIGKYAFWGMLGWWGVVAALFIFTLFVTIITGCTDWMLYRKKAKEVSGQLLETRNRNEILVFQNKRLETACEYDKKELDELREQVRALRFALACRDKKEESRKEKMN